MQESFEGWDTAASYIHYPKYSSFPCSTLQQTKLLQVFNQITYSNIKIYTILQLNDP